MSQDNKPRGPGRRGGLPGRTAGFWLLLLLLVFMTFQMMSIDRDPVHEISWTAFKNQVEVGNIRSLTKTNREVEGELVEPTEIPLSNGSAPVVQRFRLVLLAEDPSVWSSPAFPSCDQTLRRASSATRMPPVPGLPAVDVTWRPSASSSVSPDVSSAAE